MSEKRPPENTATPVTDAGDTLLSSSPRSPFKIAWRRMISSWVTVAAMLIVVFMILFSFVGPYMPGMWDHRDEDLDAEIFQSSPFVAMFSDDATVVSTWDHPLGTDGNRRDILARVMYGGQISLKVGLVASVISVLIGIVYGAISGFVGGWVDKAMMRFVDVLYSIPLMLFVILMMVVLNGLNDKAKEWDTDISVATTAYLEAQADSEMPLVEDGGSITAERRVEIDQILAEGEPKLGFFRGIFSAIFKNAGGLVAVYLALAFFYWLTMARIVRGQVLQLRKSEYVLAARALGATKWRIIFLHLIPNTLGPVIVTLTLNIPQAIFTEAYLSYLGLGVPAPDASWGTLAKDGLESMGRNPTLLIAASVAISITMLAFNYLGDALRDAFDPRIHRD